MEKKKKGVGETNKEEEEYEFWGGTKIIIFRIGTGKIRKQNSRLPKRHVEAWGLKARFPTFTGNKSNQPFLYFFLSSFCLSN